MSIHQVTWNAQEWDILRFNKLSCFEYEGECAHYFLDEEKYSEADNDASNSGDVEVLLSYALNCTTCHSVSSVVVLAIGINLVACSSNSIVISSNSIVILNNSIVVSKKWRILRWNSIVGISGVELLVFLMLYITLVLDNPFFLFEGMMSVHQVTWNAHECGILRFNKLSCFECERECTHYFLRPFTHLGYAMWTT